MQNLAGVPVTYPGVVEIGALVAMVSGLFGIVISMLMELVPSFRRWWEKVESDTKRMVRAWVGLVLSVVVTVVMYLLGEWAIEFTSVEVIVGTVISVLAGWYGFVQGGEQTYQAVKPVLPRKNSDRSA